MKINKGATALTIAGLFALCGAGTLLAKTGANDSPPPAPTTTGIGSPSVGAAVGKAAGKAASTPQRTNKPASIGEGTWKVGTDVKPGEYRTSGMLAESFMCYWHTAKTTGDEAIIDQGVSDKVTKPGLVTLKKGQYFRTSGCADWHLVK